VSTNEGGTKIPLFALHCGSIDVLTQIFVQSMWSHNEKFNYEKKKRKKGWTWTLKLLVELICSDCWDKQSLQNHIITINDYHKQIHDFVAIETHVTILPFGGVLTCAIVPNSPLPTKWSNQKQWLSC